MSPEEIGAWFVAAGMGGAAAFLRKRKPKVTLDESAFSKEWIARIEKRMQEYHKLSGVVQDMLMDVDLTKQNLAGLQRLVDRQQASLDRLEEHLDRAATRLEGKVEGIVERVGDRIDKLVDRMEAR